MCVYCGCCIFPLQKSTTYITCPQGPNFSIKKSASCCLKRKNVFAFIYLFFVCLLFKCCFSIYCLQNLDIHVEDVQIRAILSSYRKRIPVMEGYVEVKDGGKWKQICNKDWTQFNSRVICGMFGFPGERKYNPRVYKWVCVAWVVQRAEQSLNFKWVKGTYMSE